MTDAELKQIEAAKEALPKATPGEWYLDLDKRGGCLAIYPKDKQFEEVYCRSSDARNIHFSEKNAQYLYPKWSMDKQAQYDAILLVAAPALTRRVIELEAEIVKLRKWQSEAVRWLQAVSEDAARYLEIYRNSEYRTMVPIIEKNIIDINRLIAEAKEDGGDRS